MFKMNSVIIFIVSMLLLIPGWQLFAHDAPRNPWSMSGDRFQDEGSRRHQPRPIDRPSRWTQEQGPRRQYDQHPAYPSYEPIYSPYRNPMAGYPGAFHSPYLPLFTPGYGNVFDMYPGIYGPYQHYLYRGR